MRWAWCSRVSGGGRDLGRSVAARAADRGGGEAG
jgi:hypothetical protein